MIKLFLFLLLLTSTISKAQQSNYLLYHYNPLATNPAIIASKDHLKASFQHRTQWRGLDKPFNSSQISVLYPLVKIDTLYDDWGDQNLKKKRWGGIALGFLSDREGQNALIKNLAGSLALAYNFTLKKDIYLSWAMQGDLFQKNLNTNELHSPSQLFNGQIDPNLPLNESFINDNFTYFLLHSGLYFYKEDGKANHEALYFLGITAQNLNQPEIAFLENTSFRIKPKWISIGGFRAYQNDNWSINPNFIWIESIGMPRTVNIGAWFKRHYPEFKGAIIRNGSIALGTWYSWQKGWSFSLELDSPTLTFAFGYDLYTSSLSQTQGLRSSTEFVVSIKKVIGKLDERPTIQDDVPVID